MCGVWSLKSLKPRSYSSGASCCKWMSSIFLLLIPYKYYNWNDVVGFIGDESLTSHFLTTYTCKIQHNYQKMAIILKESPFPNHRILGYPFVTLPGVSQIGRPVVRLRAVHHVDDRPPSLVSPTPVLGRSSHLVIES